MAKLLVLFVLACFVLVVGAVPADAIGIKAGGGPLLDPLRWGGHVSVEIPISDDRPLALAPFFELYAKDGGKLIPVGISMVYRAPLTREVGTIYFGVGGGMLLLRSVQYELIGIPYRDSSNEIMATAAGGLLFHLSENMGFFLQTRWFMAMSNEGIDNTSKSNLAFMLGIHIGAAE